MEVEEIKLTEFDAATLGMDLQFIKAFIPYVDEKEQYIFALFIRITELTRTLDFFKNMPSPSPFYRNSHDSRHIFNELKKYCPKEMSGMLDMIGNLDDFSEIMNLFSMNDKNSSSDAKTDNILMNFLTPEQKKMYDSYQKILNL